MKLSAYCRDRQTKQYLVIERDIYKNKTEFSRELKANGYTVIRISNKRDLAAQNIGYKSFAEIKKLAKDFWSKNPELWKDELLKFERIANIEN